VKLNKLEDNFWNNTVEFFCYAFYFAFAIAASAAVVCLAASVPVGQ
jgi:hypothetical protein